MIIFICLYHSLLPDDLRASIGQNGVTTDHILVLLLFSLALEDKSSMSTSMSALSTEQLLSGSFRKWRGNGSLMMSVSFAVCSLPKKFFVDRMIIFICLYHSLLPDDLRASIGQNGVTTDHILVLLLFSLVGLQQPLALEGKSSMPTSMSALSPEQLLSGSFRKWRGNGSLMMSVFAVCSLPKKSFVDRMIIFICLYHSLLPDDLRASIGQNGVTTDHILVLLLFSLVGLQQPLALEDKSSMPTSMSALSTEQLLSGSFRKWRGNDSLMMSVSFAVCSLPKKFFADRMIIFICLYHSLLPDDLRASIGQNGVTTDRILVLLSILAPLAVPN